MPASILYMQDSLQSPATLGLLPKDMREPFQRLLTQGMVIKDGAKMSKSIGNVVGSGRNNNKSTELMYVKRLHTLRRTP